MNMDRTLTRRAIIRTGIMAAALLPVAGLIAGKTPAADLPELDTADPTAKALGYVTKSIKPGLICSGCAQFVGNAGDATGGCKIFPGKRVAGGGWCTAYVKKPGT